MSSYTPVRGDIAARRTTLSGAEKPFSLSRLLVHTPRPPMEHNILKSAINVPRFKHPRSILGYQNLISCHLCFSRAGTAIQTIYTRLASHINQPQILRSTFPFLSISSSVCLLLRYSLCRYHHRLSSCNQRLPLGRPECHDQHYFH